jgi:glyceraldehyde 3-phosphate dehydrogenase
MNIVVAINHTAPTAEALLHALQYDSTHGRNLHFDQLSIKVDSDGIKFLCFRGEAIMLTSERDPQKLQWDLYGAEYILECTGKLTTKQAAQIHIDVGKAKKVIISAPSSDAKTFVYGVNHLDYQPDSMNVVSNASCTTNCLAPIAKVLDAAYGIQAGMLTTVHASTASQHLLDGFSKKNLRLGRSGRVCEG